MKLCNISFANGAFFLLMLLSFVCVPGCRDRHFGRPKCRYASFGVSGLRSRHKGMSLSRLYYIKASEFQCSLDYYWCSLVIKHQTQPMWSHRLCLMQ